MIKKRFEVKNFERGGIWDQAHLQDVTISKAQQKADLKSEEYVSVDEASLSDIESQGGRWLTAGESCEAVLSLKLDRIAMPLRRSLWFIKRLWR